LRLADLGIVPCHRLSYDQFVLAELKEKDASPDGDDATDDLGVEVKRPELMIGHTAFDNDYQPMCEKCMINRLCTGQCLGAMYEETGDMFSPIPNVCRLEFKKVTSMIEKMREVGLLEDLKVQVREEKAVQIEKLEEMLWDSNQRKRS